MRHRPLQTALAVLALVAPVRAEAQTGSEVPPSPPPNASPPSDAPSRRVTVRGAVFDSIAGEPLANAIVQLVALDSSELSYGAQSDSTGGFRVEGVVPGRYAIGFFHPALDAIGLTSRDWLLDVGTDSLIEVNLATPSSATVRDTLCAPSLGDSSSAIVGLVRDVDTGLPVSGAMVVISWYELVLGDDGIREQRQQIPVRADARGWYAVCGLPGDAELAARAELGSRASGYLDVGVHPAGLVRASFTLPADSEAIVVSDDERPPGAEPVRRGSARLSGVVRSPDGKPVAGARVVVWGSAASASTGEDGSFTLAALPAGTHTVEARYVGFVPVRAAVDLQHGRTTTVSMALAERVSMLGAVTVFGKRSRRGAVSGFLERRRHGIGRFFTRGDIEHRKPFQLTDLLRDVPGVRVVPTAGFRYAVVMRGGSPRGCTPDVWVDGMRFSLDDASMDDYASPADITAVEVYARASEVPAVFGPAACGAVVIWTGGGASGGGAP
ncbi:MAG TPA: carboxypeptidase regulatory-like domain-containing protein [Gemmatimonadaceae bacterium]